MCGIAGFFGTPASGTPDTAVRAMTDAIVHRGPDADGAWCDHDARVALGHRRLSIIDLSPAGAQPMESASGRFVTVYNGEAYNFAPLRVELEAAGYPFRGHSDTEVLLAAFDRWGVEASIPRFAGMFAMAIWDRDERTLWLTRDRLGEKPLFYGNVDGTWLFGSELKALRAFPGWHARLNLTSIAQYFRYGYIQAPASIYQGIGKVRPGCMIALRDGQMPREVCYWSAEAAARSGLANPLVGDSAAIADALDETLRPIVRDEMMADVPLGAFLSGGIDSSLIVALMQSQSSRPVRTFTIGFDDPAFNEATFAREVAAHLGTEHTELTVRGEDALEFVERLPSIYDEPMSDSSQLPTLLVSRLTRQHVTVALSGDGGDELFGGYNWYRARGAADNLTRKSPAVVRNLVGMLLRDVPEPAPDFVLRAVSLARSGSNSDAVAATSIARLGAMMLAGGERSSFHASRAQSVSPTDLLLAEHRREIGANELTGPWLGDDLAFESRMLFDAVSYLPDDILVKVDRAAMACSLETRAPFLDHRVFELAWRIPYAAKVIGGVGKQPLRHLLDRYVPRTLVERPKAGFSVPLATWLRGPLRPWAEALLSPASLSETRLLDPVRVRRLWSQHLTGLANHADVLWSVLSLLAFVRAVSADS